MSKPLPKAREPARSRYSPSLRRVVAPRSDQVRTEQRYLQECDINTLMAKYVRTGALPEGIRVGQYGDFSTATSFFDAQMLLQTAEAQFMSLPAKVRAHFDNDPGKLLAFVHNPANRAAAQDLGLLASEGPQAKPGPSTTVPTTNLTPKPDPS